MSDEKLKACPFCGGEGRLQTTEGGDYVIYCVETCGATMFDDMNWEKEDYDGRLNVIEKWNTRVQP